MLYTNEVWKQEFLSFWYSPKNHECFHFELAYLLYLIYGWSHTQSCNICACFCGHISDLSAALLMALLASIILPVQLRWFGYIVFMYIMVRVFLGSVPIGWLKQLVFETARKALQYMPTNSTNVSTSTNFSCLPIYSLWFPFPWTRAQWLEHKIV